MSRDLVDDELKSASLEHGVTLIPLTALHPEGLGIELGDSVEVLGKKSGSNPVNLCHVLISLPVTFRPSSNSSEKPSTAA